MVIYEDMLHDGIWRNSNLHFEDGRLYANLTGTRWILLARNVKDYTIQYGFGTLIVDIVPRVWDYGKTLFRIIDDKIDISIISDTGDILQGWENSYENYLKAEKDYFTFERKVVNRLNAQTQGYGEDIV